jgi:hypothetical protein
MANPEIRAVAYARSRAQTKRARENLEDSYIRRFVPVKHPEIYAAKREHLKVFRLLKEMKK